jgi:hypothetical protein
VLVVLATTEEGKVEMSSDATVLTDVEEDVLWEVDRSLEDCVTLIRKRRVEGPLADAVVALYGDVNDAVMQER